MRVTYIRNLEFRYIENGRVYFLLNDKFISLKKSTILKIIKNEDEIVVLVPLKKFNLFSEHFSLNIKPDPFEINEFDQVDFDVLDYRGEQYLNYEEAKRKERDNQKAYKVGDIIFTHASAPGTGYIKRKVVSVNNCGVFTVTLENTVREMTLADVI